MNVLDAGGGGGGGTSTANATTSSTNSSSSNGTSSQVFNQSVQNAQNNNGTTQSNATNTPTNTTNVTQTNNNDNNTNTVSNDSDSTNTSSTVTEVAVQNDSNGDDEQSQQQQQQNALFNSRTDYGVRLLEITINAYVSARDSGQTGETEEAELNNAAVGLYEDTADELRQAAAGAEDPEAAIQEQAEIINSRIDPSTPTGEIALNVIELATTAVLAETPEQRELQVQRMRVIRAQETLDVLENRGGMRNPDWADAQAEYREATAAFQETVITDISVEVASVHYENVRDTSFTTTPTTSEISQYTADVAEARDQLLAAEQGQITLNFTDEEMQTAIQNVTERYAGLGLDAYVEAVGGAVQRNRDQTAALAQIPMELSTEVAQLHLDNARANAESNPGADADSALALAEAQFEYVANGGFAIVFTDEEMDQAVSNVQANYAELGLENYVELVGTSFTENRDLIAEENQAAYDSAYQSLSASYQEVLSVVARGDCLLTVPDELAQNDPVTAAFILALGVNADPQNPELSIQERTIAEADPIAFALLQRAGISIDTSDVNTTIVTINGVEQELTGPQLQMVRDNNVFALAGSLLSDVQFDAETQALMNATVQFRYDQTHETVSTLIAEGNHSEALRILDVNMDGAFSAEEANRLWNGIGEPTFNQQYFNDQVAGFTWDNNRDHPAAAFANWLDQGYSNLPPPAAGYMLNAIIGHYSRTEIDVLGGPGSSSFFGSLSRLVEQAPMDVPGSTQTYAGMVAEWYTTDPDAPLAFVAPMGMVSSFDFAMSEGYGSTLSNAIVARAENLVATGEYNEYSAQSLRDEYNFAFDEARAALYSKANQEVFFEFEANQTQVLSGYFDSFNSGTDITEWMTAENTPALHNMVGRALGLTPVNQEAANANDNTQNWYVSDNPGEVSDQQNVIDLTVRVLLQQAGPDGQIRAVPAYLAGETVGAQNYALFEVVNSEGVSQIIDGAALSNMIYLNPNLVDSETGRLVTNIDDLIAGDNIMAGDMNGGLYGNWKYSSFQDFQNNNDLPDNATLYIPTAFFEAQGAGNTTSVNSLLRADGSGHVEYTGVVAGVVTNGERARMIADVAIAIGSVGASIALAIPSGGTSLSLAVAAFTTTSIGYGIVRAGEEIDHMQRHGQSMSLGNPNARGAYMNGLASVAGGVAAGSGLASNIFKGSRVLSVTANVTGALTEGYGYIQTGQQGLILLQNAGNMTQGELAYEAFNMGMGIVDIGVGRWAGQQGRINAQLVDDARAAITMSYDGRAVPRDFGTLSLTDNGALNFTSAANGREITIRDGNGNIRLPDLSEPAANWLNSLGLDIDAFRETGADDLTFGDFLAGLRNNDLAIETLGDAGRPAPVAEYAQAMGVNEPVEVSEFTRMTTLGVTLLGRLSELTADFHSHSRDYARTGDAQHLISLVEKVGNYGRILIGDIAQHCGLPHYSGLDTTRLTYENSPLLDAQNVAAYTELVGNYQRWTGMIEQVRRLEISDDVDVATLVNEATIRAERDNKGRLFNENGEFIDADLAAAIDQVRQVDPELADQLTANAQRAHLALRADLSITGFDPGDPGALDYIRSRLLENPGAYRALGEITLQKEMVAVLLGEEATLFGQAGIDNFRTVLSDYLANPGDVDGLSGAFQQLLPDAPQAQNMKGILRPLEDAIESGDQSQIVDAARTLQTQLEVWERNRQEKLAEFENVLQLSAESGLAVVLHNDWGNAHTHDENGRPVATPSDYAYFDELINLVSQYPKANIVLAHTGIGRFVRPDDQLVPHPNQPGTLIPQHIAMLYDAVDRAENIRFDISWNDVGEAYVENPRMVSGLIDFLFAHPDKVLFGTDTVDPGTQSHYRQATTTLAPLFLEMIRRDPDGPQMREALWNLVRGNYEDMIDNAGTRLLDWTASALRDQGGNNADDTISTMRETADQLASGRADLRRMALEEFDATIDAVLPLIKSAVQQWENSPLRDTKPWWQFLEAEIGATPTVDPRTPPDDQLVRHDLYDIQTLGRAPELDRNHLHTDTHGEHTAHGRPATPAVFEQSRLQMAQEVARTAVAGFVGAAFSATPADVISNFSSILRQGAFAERIITEMKESADWTTIFSKGNITQETVDVLHDRIIRVARAVGAGDDQLQQVTRLTLQFQTDYQHLMNQTEWTQATKDNAIFELTGRYQINLDRALGVQARSLGVLNSRTIAGRGINNVILDTAGLSLGSTFAQAPHIVANGLTLPNIVDGLRATTDAVALTTMIARALALNHGGRTNNSLVNNHPRLRWLQTASLGALAAGGGFRVLQDVGSLLTGDPTGLLLMPVDGVIALKGGISTWNEYVTQTSRNANEEVAQNNLDLVKAIALSNGVRAIQRLINPDGNGGADEEQLQDYIPVPSHYDRPLETTQSWPEQPSQPNLPVPPEIPGPSVDMPDLEKHGSLNVIPEGGLNVRRGPSGDADPLGAFPGGAFISPTGRQSGDGWVEVIGTTSSGEQVTGWVAEQYVRRIRNSATDSGEMVLNIPAGQALSRTQFLNMYDRSHYV